ncbi:MAG: hypothetical protein IIZ92_16205 [Aquincola sp.]|nr:hypothetical protein [Aquincola sp.]
MQRKDMVLAMKEVTQAIESSGLVQLLKPDRTNKSGRDDTAAGLKILLDYSLAASRYSPAARALSKIFKLDSIEEPDIWLQLFGDATPAKVQLSRIVTTIRVELPKILELLRQETVEKSDGHQSEAPGSSTLSSVRITFVENDGQFSTVRRVIEGLSACQVIYDGLQRLNGDSSVPLAIGAIDSGSDKSFDLFGAAALMKEFRELVVSLWGLVVFHREHKLGRRLELLAAALPILERVPALEQSSRLGREEAQIIRNCFVEGTKKFVAAGVLTDDLSQHATHSPRALLAPEPKLLTGPELGRQESSESEESKNTNSATKGAGGTSSRNMSDEDLERLAEIMALKTARQTADTEQRTNGEPDVDRE